MKQYPNKLKYEKYHKLNYFFSKTLDKNTFILSNGQYGIQSLEFGKLQFKQIESCRRTIKRGLKNLGSLWINLFTNIPVTKKSIASRMGKGKGNFAYWIAPIKKGQILFEVSGFNLNKIINLLFKSKNKLPIKTKITKLRY